MPDPAPYGCLSPLEAEGKPIPGRHPGSEHVRPCAKARCIRLTSRTLRLNGSGVRRSGITGVGGRQNQAIHPSFYAAIPTGSNGVEITSGTSHLPMRKENERSVVLERVAFGRRIRCLRLMSFISRSDACAGKTSCNCPMRPPCPPSCFFHRDARHDSMHLRRVPAALQVGMLPRGRWRNSLTISPECV